MNAEGEIRQLAQICKPSIGLITNIGPCHLEDLKTIEDVTSAKAELFEQFHSNNIAILNMDDPRVATIAENISANLVTYGIKHGDIHASNIQAHGDFGTSFDIHVMGKTTTVKMNSLGIHFLINALAAAAIAYTLGISVKDIKDGLESFKGVPGRMEIVHLDKITVINDSYNANPVSMKASLQTLSSLTSCKRRFAVLGDMLELGSQAEKFHEETGKTAASLNIDGLFAAGDFSPSVKKGALLGGMDNEKITVCNNLKQLAKILKNVTGAGDIILLKGSRRMQMEKIIAYLKDPSADQTTDC